MDEITNRWRALLEVTKRGYLNEFSSRCDYWFVIHSVPGGMAIDCPVVAVKVAEEMIDNGMVTKVGEGQSLEDPSCRLTWYKRASEADRPPR
jgi:hypothetical protein